MIEIVSKMDKKVSEVLKDMPLEFFERIEIECSDKVKFEIAEKIKEKVIENYQNVNTIDGVRIDFPDSWALIRASNTSPRLRLSIEARDEKRLKELKTETMNLMNSILRSYGK